MKKSLLHRRLLLHEEIIEAILSRLPVKSLLRFRCVSKSWLSLIDSDRFIKIHFRNSTKTTNYKVIYNNVERSATIATIGCSVQSLLILNSKEGTSITVDPTNNIQGFVVGCCNGVLCLSNYPYNHLALCNPATREFMQLPELERASPKCGFGWDESTAAFKFFATTFPDYNMIGQVYSTKTNSWKTVPLGSHSLFNFIGVFVGGRSHWPMGLHACDEHVIESFDLESDEFGRIELPPFNANANADADAEEGGRPETWLGEIGGCLCSLFDFKKSVDIWVMKEYGVKKSWFKLLTFPLVVCQTRLHNIYALSPLFGKGPNRKIFMDYRDNQNIVVYSFKDDAFSTVTGLSGAHIYIESLVSPLRILGGTKIT